MKGDVVVLGRSDEKRRLSLRGWRAAWSEPGVPFRRLRPTLADSGGQNGAARTGVALSALTGLGRLLARGVQCREVRFADPERLNSQSILSSWALNSSRR